ncbi:MAG: DapH/DapD/GlmU-related protein [Acidobacteriota bacterium]
MNKIKIRGKDFLFWEEKIPGLKGQQFISPKDTEEIVLKYQIDFYTKNGIIFEDFSNFFIEGLPSIGKDTKIGPGVTIRGNSTIGDDVELYPNCYIENSQIGDNCSILPGTIISDSILRDNVRIGPYAHLRSGCLVKENAKVGNFVEMKKSEFGEGSKAMHLSYVGDSTVGKNVNIGAGTITCNYDGKNKNPTIIEDKAFIGSGTELIAPIKIGKNSYVAAGSTVNEDVPEDALAVARQKQKNIKGWSKRKKR